MDEAAVRGSRQRRRAWGVSSLAVMTVDVLLMGWSVAAAGDGVDSGIGVALVFLACGLPLAVVALILATVALVRRSGTVFAALTLAVLPSLLVAGVLWRSVTAHN